MPRQAPRQIEAVIAANLRAARKAQGLKHHELAALLGVDPTYIARWERAALRPDVKPIVPSMKNMVRLADALGEDVSWFYVDRNPEERAA